MTLSLPILWSNEKTARTPHRHTTNTTATSLFRVGTQKNEIILAILGDKIFADQFDPIIFPNILFLTRSCRTASGTLHFTEGDIEISKHGLLIKGESPQTARAPLTPGNESPSPTKVKYILESNKNVLPFFGKNKSQFIIRMNDRNIFSENIGSDDSCSWMVLVVIFSV